jgi:hypothetical protein
LPGGTENGRPYSVFYLLLNFIPRFAPFAPLRENACSFSAHPSAFAVGIAGLKSQIRPCPASGKKTGGEEEKNFLAKTQRAPRFKSKSQRRDFTQRP